MLQISFKTVGLMIRTIDFWSAILWRFYDSLYLLHRTAPFHIEDTSPKIRVFLSFQIPAVLAVTQQSLGVDKYRFIDYVDRELFSRRKIF